ncbi:MAG TPA: SdiA-regulated domain-containing protein [Gemmatimonadales bacterium]|jgi:hypothetical protein|nr:SdiA-regulated domain-containing protein [Gemmatimonadales bacterium]
MGNSFVRWRAAALALCIALAVACRPGGAKGPAKPDSSKLSARVDRFERALALPDSGKTKDEPVARWLLPQSLSEVSGLAITPNDRLLAHGDEQGRVVEIDYRRGTVLKQFLVGSPPVRADFEGITVAGNAIYLLASNGKLYEFREGADGARVRYAVHDTHLGQECEFEGVAFEAASNSLLLACKTVGKKSLRGFLVIYRWKLVGGSAARLSEFKVPLNRIIGSRNWKGFHPTDISVDPSSGNYVLVASPEKALVELTPQGEVVSAGPLPGRHTQPEGLAITKDGILIVGDEGRQQRGAITLYRRH